MGWEIGYGLGRRGVGRGDDIGLRKGWGTEPFSLFAFFISIVLGLVMGYPCCREEAFLSFVLILQFSPHICSFLLPFRLDLGMEKGDYRRIEDVAVIRGGRIREDWHT
jgi:hypothetical protein